MTGIGICLPQLGEHVEGAVVRDFCAKAEDLGFTSLWVQEHLFYPEDPVSGYAGVPGLPIPQPYRSVLGATELLAAAAAWTKSALIGTSILVGGYHRPLELAQRLATIDLLSEGRLVAGFGVGWSVDEHEQSDTSTKVRGRRLSDLVRAVRACWEDDPVSYDGEFFTIPSATVRPKPVQTRVPFISGSMTDAGRARAVELFDGWNPAGLPAAAVAPMVEEMNGQRSDEAGPLSVWHRVFWQGPGQDEADLDATLAECAAAVEAGFREVIIDTNFNTGIDHPKRWLEVLDDLAPAVQAARS